MAVQPEPLHIQSIPVSQRRYIVVESDAVIADIRKSQDEESQKTYDLKKMALQVGKQLWSTSVWGQAASGVSYLASRLWPSENGLQPLRISFTEANSLQFVLGHPREKTLYVVHPAKPTVYYAVASFHRLVFEHKFAEAVLLLTSLGAQEIEVEHIYGWGKEFAAQISVPTGEVSAGFEASTKRSSKSSILMSARYKNQRLASIPENLVWLPHEPSWEALVDGRMNRGLREFQLALNYTEDFGVNAGLKASAQGAKLEVGGTFEDHVSTSWQISAKFYEIPS